MFCLSLISCASVIKELFKEERSSNEVEGPQKAIQEQHAGQNIFEETVAQSRWPMPDVGNREARSVDPLPIFKRYLKIGLSYTKPRMFISKIMLPNTTCVTVLTGIRAEALELDFLCRLYFPEN